MSDPLKVACPHCGGSLKVKDRSAEGKKVRCPKCQEAFKVEFPTAETEDLEDDFGGDFGGDEELPEEEESPRRSKGAGSSKKPVKAVKKKRKGQGAAIPWMIIGIAAAGLLCVGGLGALIVTFSGGGGSNKIDLTYLPDDANMIVQLKVNELLGSPLLADILTQPAAQQMLAQQAQQTGMNARDLVTVTVGLVVDESSSPLNGGMLGRRAARAEPRTVTVVRSSVPLKADEIGVTQLKGVAQVMNGKTYYKPTNGTKFPALGADAIHFPESNVMVAGAEADILKIVNGAVKPVRRREYDFINPNATLLLAFAPKSPPNPAAALEAPAGQPDLQALERVSNKSFRAGSLGLRMSDKVDLEILVKCADGTGAGEFKTAVESLVARMKSEFERTKTNLTLMGLTDVITLGDKTLASLKIEQNGVMVAATGTIPSEVQAVGKSLSGMLPGMMGGGMRPPPPRQFGPPGSSNPIPPSQFPGAGSSPTGSPSPGSFPPGQFPPGQVPDGAFPPGGTPPGTPPPGGASP